MDSPDRIRDFIARTFGKSVGPDDSLLDSGLVDSTGIFELVTFLEASFAVTIDNDDIVPEHFETPTLIAGFIDRKRAGMAP